jgi:hypothetical protein
MKTEEMSNVYAQIDGTFRRLTKAEARAQAEQAQREEADRIAAGGCPHPIDEWEHGYDEDSAFGDYYWCGRCGELTQVG